MTTGPKIDYALLLAPSANRVYAGSAVALSAAELRVFGDRALGGELTDIEPTQIGGVGYLAFAGPEDLQVAEVLGNLSAAYALFRRRTDGALDPVPLAKLDRFDDDLLTVQKYAGKTNEQFTKLLLNLTVLASDFAAELAGPVGGRRLRVLDPLCGRGTTLNQALMYGYDAAGVDVDAKDFDAYTAFLRTWLKNKRLKHTAEVVRVRRDHQQVGRRFEATVGVTKEAFKSGEVLRLDYVNADTTKAARFFRPNTFHAVVADAPYGVQHGSRAGQELQRSPLDLLRAALPGWTTLLRPGGALGLSWNTKVASRDAALEVLAGAGLEPVDGGAYSAFSHRVDQAITRDIVLARARR